MSDGLTHTRDYSRIILRRFLIFFVPSISVLLIIGAVHYFSNWQAREAARIANEVRDVALMRRVVLSELRTILSDLTFLAKLNELWDLLDDADDERARLLVSQEFLYFSEKKGIYDQIRLLDVDGMEVIRINYDEGYPYIVAQSELQNKQDRYYFRDALAMELGHVYVSSFDLNVEEGQIVEPPRPVIRLGTLLFNSQGEKRGVLLFNYMGDKLIQSFKHAVTAAADRSHLLNAEGYWLSSPSPEDEWGFMYPHQHAFGKRYPTAWQSISAREDGHFYTSEGLFTFTTIHPRQLWSQFYPASGSTDQPVPPPTGGPAQTWKVVLHIPPPELKHQSQALFRDHLTTYSPAALLLLLGSAFAARTAAKNELIKSQKEFERRFRNTLETMQLAAVTLDREGRITFCNDFFLETTGWRHQTIVGENWFERCIPDEDRPDARQMFSEILDGRAPPYNPITRIKTQRGDTRLFAWNNTVSWDPGGKVTAITRIGEDITEKRHAEEQLRKLSRAVEQSPNPVIITNADGIIEYVNPKFTQLTGYTSDEVIGQTPSLLKSGETDSKEYGTLWKTITAGNEWRGVFHNRKKNGELYWENTAISPIRDIHGNITHFLAVKEDITEHLSLKEEVEKRNRELAHAKTLAAMGRMASMVAHDLRNPLSSIKMALQILGKRASQEGDQEAKELKHIALDRVRYMEDILADLLEYSRPDALKPEWLSINKVLDSAISTSEKAISDYHAKVVTDYQSQLPTIHGDATKLHRVFSNLLINALAATEKTDITPEIHIDTCLELSDSTPKVQVRIYDNGPGIDTDNVAQLFEPFFTTRAKGTGLGLAIVKRVVDQHRGTISLTQADAGGACATVTLPTGPLE